MVHFGGWIRSWIITLWTLTWQRLNYLK